MPVKPRRTAKRAAKRNRLTAEQVAEAIERLESVDHAVSIEDWTAFLWANQPEEYASRPLPARPEVVLTPEAREALYTIREAQGVSLFHPDDLLYSENHGYLVRHGGNLVLQQRGIAI